MESSVKFQAATYKLDYKMKLFDYYTKLKKEDGLSDAAILQVFPEMEVVMLDK